MFNLFFNLLESNINLKLITDLINELKNSNKIKKTELRKTNYQQKRSSPLKFYDNNNNESKSELKIIEKLKSQILIKLDDVDEDNIEDLNKIKSNENDNQKLMDPEKELSIRKEIKSNKKTNRSLKSRKRGNLKRKSAGKNFWKPFKDSIFKKSKSKFTTLHHNTLDKDNVDTSFSSDLIQRASKSMNPLKKTYYDEKLARKHEQIKQFNEMKQIYHNKLLEMKRNIEYIKKGIIERNNYFNESIDDIYQKGWELLNYFKDNSNLDQNSIKMFESNLNQLKFDDLNLDQMQTCLQKIREAVYRIKL